MTSPDAIQNSERDLARGLLGPDIAPQRLPDSQHVVTRWQATGGSLVTKRYGSEAAYATELTALQALDRAGCPGVPRLLSHRRQVIAMSWLPGQSFLERFDPSRAELEATAFLQAASVVASLQVAGRTVQRERLRDATADGIPGPQGFSHGDALPHNLLVSETGVSLIDFEHCGWGHCLLDLAPIACVLGEDMRAAMLRRYCSVRNWKTASVSDAYAEVVRTWPRTFGARLSSGELAPLSPIRAAKLATWCEAGIEATR